jgi:hypothetical protein
MRAIGDVGGWEGACTCFSGDCYVMIVTSTSAWFSGDLILSDLFAADNERLHPDRGM